MPIDPGSDDLDSYEPDTDDTSVTDTGTSGTSTSSSSTRGTSAPTDPDSDYVTPVNEELGSSNEWTQKLDFSKPYVIVALDRSGDVYVSKGEYVAIKEPDDWRRLFDSPDREHMVWEKDLRVQFKAPTKEHWLNLCDLIDNQFGEDASELLEEKPLQLGPLADDVIWPPGSKPTSDRFCQVCDSPDSDPSVNIVEIDLHETRKVPVCASHSVEDLAENGFLS